MKKVLCILFFVVSSSFTYVEEANKIINRITTEVCKQTGLRAFGTGGSMCQDVEGLDLAFIKNELLNLDKARIYYVKTALIALNTVNSNKTIRPYLHNYPFTLANFNLSIHFLDSNSNDPKPPLIARIMNFNNLIEYETKRTDIPHKYDTVHQETLEEAIRIVNQDTAANLLRKPK